MDMRSRAATAIAEFADLLVQFHPLSVLYRNPVKMCVTRHEAVAVIDFHDAPEALAHACEFNDAARRRRDRRRPRGREIDAVMARRPAVERVAADAETACKLSADGQGRGKGDRIDGVLDVAKLVNDQAGAVGVAEK